LEADEYQNTPSRKRQMVGRSQVRCSKFLLNLEIYKVRRMNSNGKFINSKLEIIPIVLSVMFTNAGFSGFEDIKKNSRNKAIGANN
jgi:hypothetical protein